MNKEETMKKSSFSAMVKDPSSDQEIPIDVELDKDEYSLTYDEVEAAIYQKLKEDHGIDYYDSCIDNEDAPSIIDIVINSDDGNQYPVISESMDDAELKKSHAFEKYLVLPDARYSLTPECKLWMSLQKRGIIDANEPFDFETYHELLEDSSEMK